MIILIATFALRRKRRKKLENEAISYDPSVGRGSYHDDMESRLVSDKASDHRSSYGHSSSANAYGTTYAPNPHGMHYNQGRNPAYGQYPNYPARSPNPLEHQQAYGPNYNVGVGAPLRSHSPNPTYDPGLYNAELHRSSSRGSNKSDTLPPVPPPHPQMPPSLLSGAAVKSPPPAATHPPTPPQLPPVFGDNGSIDERQGHSAIDLKVANQ
jgi:hypothetical protein